MVDNFGGNLSGPINSNCLVAIARKPQLLPGIYAIMSLIRCSNSNHDKLNQHNQSDSVYCNPETLDLSIHLWRVAYDYDMPFCVKSMFHVL